MPRPFPDTEEVEQISKYTRNSKPWREGIYGVGSQKEVANYDYIHVATHGRFNSRGAHVFLFVDGNSNEDDGKLTVTEIMDMQINAGL